MLLHKYITKLQNATKICHEEISKDNAVARECVPRTVEVGTAATLYMFAAVINAGVEFKNSLCLQWFSSIVSSEGPRPPTSTAHEYASITTVITDSVVPWSSKRTHNKLGTIKMRLVRKATGNHLIKNTAMEKNSESCL